MTAIFLERSNKTLIGLEDRRNKTDNLFDFTKMQHFQLKYLLIIQAESRLFLGALFCVCGLESIDMDILYCGT